MCQYKHIVCLVQVFLRVHGERQVDVASSYEVQRDWGQIHANDSMNLNESLSCGFPENIG